MLRVLHIVTRLDFGGPPDDLLLLLTRLPRTQLDSTLVSGLTVDPPPGLAETLSRAHVSWTKVAYLRRAVSPLADMSALWQLTRVIRRARPDIVHTHTSKAGFLGRLAARMVGVRRIVHTPHGHVFYGYYGPVATRAFIALERLAARFTERIIVLTDAEASQHLAVGVGRPEQFVTIPSGVDLERVQAASVSGPRVRRDLGIPGNTPVLGAVSRLVPVKGLQHLIAAMPEILRRCPGTHLAIAGEGEERATLEAQVKSLGLAPWVHFLGYRDDAEAVIAALSVFVLPSLNEGMGRALVTAMALGVPVVATRVGGVPEVVEDGRQGLLVPPADAAALVKAVCDLLQDRSRAEAMGAAGRARAPLFSIQVMVERHATLYREVMVDAGTQ
jgi:glycosyltransferase involved in cell wall biosynthesis